jgi:preprotein translocase subunit SecY
VSDRYRFFAFIATLIALVLMFIAACVLLWQGRSVEAVGIGGALTGLIGLAGVLAGGKNSPENQDVTVTNAPTNPAHVTDDREK